MSTKYVLITGCTDGGIGSALAIVFHRKGYHVIATARNPNTMGALKDLRNMTFLRLDVTNQTQITDAVAAVTKETDGRLHYLINNAGHNRYMPILDENIAEARELFDTNVWGSLAVTQAFAPLVIQAKGTIGFVTSIAGHVNVPYMGESAHALHLAEC
jgi:NADP-dependent 3-hydroxy acid dehydrogenase YdfG